MWNGDGWADWVKSLHGKSGVYVLRSIRSKKVLYVGSSYTGRLKKTMIRHLQNWSGPTAGKTFSRYWVEGSVLLLPSDADVVDHWERKLIARLKPKTNKYESSDEVPF